MTPARSIPRRAFTLLETLLAVSVLSAATLLIGAMWSQARAWADDAHDAERSLRLQRVSEAVRRQWNDRRTAVSLGATAAAVRATPDELSFVTATPLLFPDWPLVTATYRIQRQPGSPLGDAARFDLLYIETRIAEVGAAATPAAAAAHDDRLRGTWTLLTGVRNLRFERFGAAQPSPILADAEADDAPPSGDDRQSGTTPSDDRIQRWRKFDKPDARPIPAVRLLGEFHKEPFACVFVIEALR